MVSGAHDVVCIVYMCQVWVTLCVNKSHSVRDMCGGSRGVMRIDNICVMSVQCARTCVAHTHHMHMLSIFSVVWHGCDT